MYSMYSISSPALYVVLLPVYGRGVRERGGVQILQSRGVVVLLCVCDHPAAHLARGGLKQGKLHCQLKPKTSRGIPQYLKCHTWGGGGGGLAPALATAL
jgi:hypothetical protein